MHKNYNIDLTDHMVYPNSRGLPSSHDILRGYVAHTLCTSTLESCGMTDDDIPDLVNCLNDVGRDNIEEL